MFRLPFLLSIAVFLSSSFPLDSISVSASAPFASVSHLNQQLLSLRHFKTRAAPSPSSICSPTYGCLPDGFPVPDPSTVQYIQFPNGITVNLAGFGSASLPAGYPLQELPSYDSSTNTVKDPVLAAILAWSLSTQANPGFSGGDWGGFSLPGVPGSSDGTESTGSGIINDDNNNNNNNNNGGAVLSTGGNGNGIGNGNVGGLTGTNGNGNGNVGSNTGSTNNNNGGATGTNTNGGTGTATNTNGGTGTNTNGGTTNNNNGGGGGGLSKNGASVVAGSISLVAGLALATVLAVLL